ncbi:tRNA(Ile)-lysidine synthetase, partial [Candidatus Poribacteria bacterium]
SSNLKPVYTRNRIRLELMPLLREFNPRIEEVLARAGEISAEEDELMERLAIEKLGALALERKEGFVRLRGDELAGLPVALRRRVVRAAVREVKGDLLNIDFDHIESILDLISSPNPNLKLDLPGLRAERRYSELIIASEPEEEVGEYEYRLPIPGEVEIPEAGLKLIAEVHEERPPMPKNPDAALLDYDKLSPPLVVRNRRPGDRFRPLGMKGSKKVKDFFIDIKLPLPERDRVPILVSGGQIAWIVGHRIDDRFKVTGETKRFALIKAVRCGDGRRDTG